MAAYYNEWDKGAAEWLRELIKAGLIPKGYVDERSITEVTPADLEGFTQCHFFAGIGGWSLALRMAGWPDDDLIWTGSCPCQPFSMAGKQEGYQDERHLAPVWLHLIQECRPPVLFGEQVAAAIKKHWLDDLFNALENENYTCGSAVLPACCIGSPQIRQRLFFGAKRLADSGCVSSTSEDKTPDNRQSATGSPRILSGHSLSLGRLDNADDKRPQRYTGDDCSAKRSGTFRSAPPSSMSNVVASSNGEQQRQNRVSGPGTKHTKRRREQNSAEITGLCDNSDPNPDYSFWSDADWIGCRDGKFRPIEPGTFPLDNGIPARVVKLRAYGNAIVPQVAEAFITAFLDAIMDIN